MRRLSVSSMTSSVDVSWSSALPWPKIGPVRWLPLRQRLRQAERAPSAFGRGPVRRFWLNERRVSVRKKEGDEDGESGPETSEDEDDDDDDDDDDVVDSDCHLSLSRLLPRLLLLPFKHARADVEGTSSGKTRKSASSCWAASFSFVRRISLADAAYLMP